MYSKNLRNVYYCINLGRTEYIVYLFDRAGRFMELTELLTGMRSLLKLKVSSAEKYYAVQFCSTYLNFRCMASTLRNGTLFWESHLRRWFDCEDTSIWSQRDFPGVLGPSHPATFGFWPPCLLQLVSVWNHIEAGWRRAFAQLSRFFPSLSVWRKISQLLN